MPRYSPELIQQTILLLQDRTDQRISEEDARQAVENISGFFQILQEWRQADITPKVSNSSSHNWEAA
jgi:hypothetical protein